MDIDKEPTIFFLNSQDILKMYNKNVKEKYGKRKKAIKIRQMTNILRKKNYPTITTEEIMTFVVTRRVKVKRYMAAPSVVRKLMPELFEDAKLIELNKELINNVNQDVALKLLNVGDMEDMEDMEDSDE